MRDNEKDERTEKENLIFWAVANPVSLAFFLFLDL